MSGNKSEIRSENVKQILERRGMNVSAIPELVTLIAEWEANVEEFSKLRGTFLHRRSVDEMAEDYRLAAISDRFDAERMLKKLGRVAKWFYNEPLELEFPHDSGPADVQLIIDAVSKFPPDDQLTHFCQPSNRRYFQGIDRRAVKALVLATGKAKFETRLALLSHSNERIRGISHEVFATIRKEGGASIKDSSPSSLTAIAEALGHENMDVRWVAIWTIGVTGKPGQVLFDRLMLIFKNESNIEMRFAAAHAMVRNRSDCERCHQRDN